jgi:glycosyltransferase involved in cell wall biosynthesis
VQVGENILLADTPSDFADSVVSLLRDPDERKRMGTTARILVEEKYSWPKVADNFARTLHEAVVSFKPSDISGN